jgi:hypothetical protein
MTMVRTRRALPLVKRESFQLRISAPLLLEVARMEDPPGPGYIDRKELVRQQRGVS